MKFVVQKVLSSSVEVEKKIISSIKLGYLVLVGFTHDDNKNMIDKMIDKLLKLRIFEDVNNKTNLSIYDVDGEILIVPQFTLYGNVISSNRPSFSKALDYKNSEELFEYLKSKIKSKYNKVCFGKFGADMKVNIINNGPFTLVIDSLELYGNK